jgi:hypothetical protein
MGPGDTFRGSRPLGLVVISVMRTQTIRLSSIIHFLLRVFFYMSCNKIVVVAKGAERPETSMTFLRTESSWDQVYPPKNDILIAEWLARSKIHCAVLCRNKEDCNHWNYPKLTGKCSLFRHEILQSFTFPCGRDRFWQVW